MSAPGYDIKPCPFCGLVPVVPECFDVDQGDKWGRVRCTSCGADGPETRTGYDMRDDAPWRLDAVDEWNRREGARAR